MEYFEAQCQEKIQYIKQSLEAQITALRGQVRKYTILYYIRSYHYAELEANSA